jgi:hypothetical protein
LGLQFIEMLVFLAEVAGNGGANREGAGFESHEVRFRFAHMKQHDLGAVGAGHVAGRVEDAGGNVGEIDWYEDGFHLACTSGIEFSLKIGVVVQPLLGRNQPWVAIAQGLVGEE